MLPDEIIPKRRERLMDLIQSVGVDVSDWPNYAKGRTHAAANPRYCYEWAFVEPGRCVVLNLWRKGMVETADGGIEQHLNLRRGQITETNGARRKRRDAMRAAIELAYKSELPVRVVVVDSRPSKTGKATKAGADFRTLDPLPWAVTKIASNGDIVLRRGASVAPFVDQFSLLDLSTGQPTKRDVTGSVYERSRDVRRNVLQRAGGVCELCGTRGFKLCNGGVYLETHHVVPLCEDGRDHEDNVVALCPNDHREAHYGERRAEFRATLLGFLAKRAGTRMKVVA